MIDRSRSEKTLDGVGMNLPVHPFDLRSVLAVRPDVDGSMPDCPVYRVLAEGTVVDVGVGRRSMRVTFSLMNLRACFLARLGTVLSWTSPPRSTVASEVERSDAGRATAQGASGRPLTHRGPGASSPTGFSTTHSRG